MKKWVKQALSLTLILMNCLTATATYAEYIDGIVAIVEDDIILESELQQEVAAVMRNIQGSNINIPPAFIMRKQVLDRLILLKLQTQRAERVGIRVSDEILNNAVSEIAQRNNMSLDQFRLQLTKQGMDYQQFVENIRQEISNNQLKANEIGNRVRVSDREIDHHLETQGQEGINKIQYHLGHILIATPDSATPAKVASTRIKAEALVKALRNGKDFKSLAMTESNGAQALSGGDLGWRLFNQIPTIFVEYVTKLSSGEIADPIRSPSGFHIIKMLGIKGLGKRMITQTNTRHILLKLNELINDDDAKNRLLKLKDRIDQGEDFAVLAQEHSDDKVSAIKGGSLDWVSPDFLVPPFEYAMNKLAINEVSEPVQTQFGWHIIQVLGRQERDNSEEFKRTQVREQLRNLKIEEETELWLWQLRDEAFVEIKSEKL